MSDLEKSVRELLRAEDWTIPASTAAVERIELAVHRRRRNRWAALAAIGLAVVGIGGGLAATSLTVSGRSQAANRKIIPWRDAPVAGHISLVTKASADAPACRATDLAVAETHTGAYNGMTIQSVTLRNAGQSTCSVDGFPTVSGVSATGASIALGGTDSGSSTVVLLNAGDETTNWVTAIGYCASAPPANVLTTLTFGLPEGGTITVPGTTLNIACGGVTVTPFEPAQSNAAVATGPLSDLETSLTLPSTVAPGSTLTYSVTITNPSNASVQLSPCPSYQEQLGTVVASDYDLNCSVGEIPANSSLTFAMQLSVPANAPAGLTKFGWFSNEGLAAGRVIMVG
jgi:hypothetical protein